MTRKRAIVYNLLTTNQLKKLAVNNATHKDRQHIRHATENLYNYAFHHDCRCRCQVFNPA